MFLSFKWDEFFIPFFVLSFFLCTFSLIMLNEYTAVIEILEDVLGEHRYHNDYKGQISFDCPVCSYEIKGLDEGDGKGNLEVNYMSNVYKCWSCGETHETHGSLYKLIKTHGNKKQLKNFLILNPDQKPKSNKEFAKVKLPKELVKFKDMTNGFKLTHNYKTVWNYLNSRGITEDMINKYDIGVCFSGEYANRFIIPSYDERGYINYFVSRTFLTRYVKNKYKNPEALKEEIIWNINLINWEKPIYIVEGPIDSMFLDNSIPMLGKKMSDLLFETLYERAKEVVIVLDGDAWMDTEKLFHKLNCGRLMGKVSVVKLPLDKDIADLRGDLSEYKPFKIE